MMISPARERAVVKLLDLGRSCRDVARRTGVSRDIVLRIASGSRRADASQRAVAARQQRKADERGRRAEGRKRRRCPTCGGLMVSRVCRVCPALALRAKRPLKIRQAELRWLLRESPRIGLELRPEHRRRYQEIRHTGGGEKTTSRVSP